MVNELISALVQSITHSFISFHFISFHSLFIRSPTHWSIHNSLTRSFVNSPTHSFIHPTDQPYDEFNEAPMAGIQKAGLSGPESPRDAATLLQTGTPTINWAIQGTPSAALFGCPSSQRMLGEMKICLRKECVLTCTCMRYYKLTRHRT